MDERPFKKESVHGNRSLLFVLGVAVALAGVAAVGGYFIYDRSDENKFGTTTTTGATSHLDMQDKSVGPRDYGGINADAHVRLAEVRCDRDERCQNVGAGKRYGDREACISERRAQSDALIPAVRCNQGMNPDRVETCVAAIENAPCNVSLESLDGIESCRAQSLCKAMQ